jgi:hypothetical protein
MAKDQVLHVRYLGITPQSGHREYCFRVEDKDKGDRQVVLTIEDGVFRGSLLAFQEAPDLCYQKLLTDVTSATAGASIQARIAVSRSDIDTYRGSHAIAKLRMNHARKRQ